MRRVALGVWIAAAGQLALHVATGWRYGYFVDELYYLACAAHPAWGYVDHPPLSIALLGAWTSLFGVALPALRLPAALATAAIVVLSGALARELGGGPRAQTLAALCAAIAPVNLVIGGYYSMNALDAAVWAAALYLVVRLLDRPTPARWLGLGALLGLGLLNKLSVLWLGAGLAVGLVATPYRGLLRTPWPWLAGALALALFAPHVVWQVRNDWPTLEFIRVATEQKMLPVGPLELLAQQALAMHPLTLPIWIGGLGWLLFAGRRRPAPVLGIVFLVVAGILIANGTSRPNYLALAQPPLLAGGCIWIERFSARRLAPAVGALLVAGGLALAPVGVPLLPPEAFGAYSDLIGIRAPRMERSELAALPQHFADMHGWPEHVAEVARAYRALPPEDRERAVVFAEDYGYAGAVDLLGPPLGLPGAVSGHNSYWLWGPGDASGEVVLVMGGDLAGLREAFASVEQVGLLRCTWCVPGRDNRPLYLARRPRRPLHELWPATRHYE